MNSYYTSPAFVLSCAERGDADSLVRVYTKEFGLINVLARGIRNEKSKLRYHLKHFRLVRVAVVENKDYFTLIDADTMEEEPERSLNEYAYLRELTAFIGKIVPCAQKDEDVWSLVRAVYERGYIPLDSNAVLAVKLHALYISGMLAYDACRTRGRDAQRFFEQAVSARKTPLAALSNNGKLQLKEILNGTLLANHMVQ